MTDKELKKLSRAELLELLLLQTKRAEELEAKLVEAKEQLENKEIAIDTAGSIAGAALQLSGIFEKAEIAAAEYLQNIKTLSERQETVCQRMENESRKKAEKMIADAELECEKKKQAVDAYCKAASQKLQLMVNGVKGIKENNNQTPGGKRNI